MKDIFKYNLSKGISLLLTVGTPITIVILCSDFIVHSSAASISMTGVIALLFSALFLKDKIAENVKFTSPFIIASILFVSILLLESILIPMKYACLGTIIASGIDELTCKRIYKQTEKFLPETAEVYKHFGFYICKTKDIKNVNNIEEQL